MTPSLKLAAESLHARLKAVHCSLPRSLTPAKSWKSLLDKYEGGFPMDYVSMMAAFPFDYVTLGYMCQNEARRYPENVDVYFRFRGTTTFYGTDFMSGFDDVLMRMSLAAIGEADDGDFWVVTTSTGVDGPVYYVSHTAWNGDQLDFDNGLTCAAPSLAHLIASFALSGAEFGFDWRTKRYEVELDLELFPPYQADDQVYQFHKTD